MSDPVPLRIVATHYPHFGRHAGIGQFVRHLDPAAFSVTRRRVPDHSVFPVPVFRNAYQARLGRRGMEWYKFDDHVEELRTLAACLTGRARLVHFLDGEHGLQFLPHWLDRMPGRRVPIVASYHQPSTLLPDLLDPEVVARLDAVVLVSPAQEEAFEGLLPRERVVTILHGIDTEFFSPGPPPEDGVFRCVTAGHWLRDWTAIRAAVETFSRRSDAEFHIVTGRETGLDHLPNVHFHQNLSDEELLALYRRCDLGFLPLTDSTANNSLLEFIACGLPILSTDIASVRAYVGPDEAVLLPKGNMQAGDAIDALLADRPRRLSMGEKARARALSLAWPSVAQQYSDLYKRLLA